MSEVLVSLINRLPTGYTMTLLPVLIIVAIALAMRLRRDKNGKWYLYSKRYEDKKRNRKQDAILEQIQKSIHVQMANRKDILQLQICAVDLVPVAKRLALIEYKELGFNSWVDQYVVDKNIVTDQELEFIVAQASKKDGGDNANK